MRARGKTRKGANRTKSAEIYPVSWALLPVCVIESKSETGRSAQLTGETGETGEIKEVKEVKEVASGVNAIAAESLTPLRDTQLRIWKCITAENGTRTAEQSPSFCV